MAMTPKDNANTTKKGVFLGQRKRQGHSNNEMKSSPMASSGSFGKAKTIASGKKNFSRGAPGHSSTGDFGSGSPSNGL